MKKFVSLLVVAWSLSTPAIHAQTWREKRQASSDLKIERKKSDKKAREEYLRKREDGPPFYLSNRSALYTTPTDILSPYGALLSIGITHYISKRAACSIDLSIPLFFNVFSAFEQGPAKSIKSDIALHGDVKWYFRIKSTRRFFTGLDATFRKQHFIRYNTEIGYTEKYFKVSELEAQKTSFGLGATFGQEFRLKPRLIFETKIGIGLRYITMSHNFTPTGQVNPGPEFISVSVPPLEDQVGSGAFATYYPIAISFKYLLK